MPHTLPAFIQRRTPLSSAQDYALLRETALQWLRDRAGHIWTDHNAHDPGITILEVLCLALTEQSFLTGLPVADLIQAASGPGAEARDFFGKTAVLPAAPLTPRDWRKFLVDRPEIRNAWVQPLSGETGPAIFFANNALSFNEQGLAISPLKGLYEVLLEWDNDPVLGDLNGNLLSAAVNLTLPDGQIRAFGADFIFPFTWDNDEIVDSAVPGVRYSIFRNILNIEAPLALDGATELLQPELRDTYFSEVTITHDGGQSVTIGVSTRISSSLTGAGEIALAKAALATMLTEMNGPVALYNRRVARAFQLRQQAAALLVSKRNLAEDFARFRAVHIQEIGINAEFELTPGADAEATLASVFYALDRFIDPALKFISYEQAETESGDTQSIWEGPWLQSGYLDDEQLRRAPGRAIFLSDLLRVMLQNDDGSRRDTVVAIFNLSASSFLNNQASGESAENCLRLVDDFTYRPRLSVFKSNITLRERGIAKPFDVNRVVALYRARQLQAAGLPVLQSGPAAPVSGQELPQFPEYQSIQPDFPGLYQLSVEERTPTNAQLRGYLFFFEQLLANQLLLLRHAPTLLSIQNTSTETYFPANLRHLLPVFADYLTPDYENALLSPAEANVRRRTEVLDHLLARLGEDFRFYGLWHKLSGVALNQAKFEFLQALPLLAGARGQAFDYTQASWNTDNVSVAERKLKHLLQLSGDLRRTLWRDPSGRFEIVSTGAPPATTFGFLILDAASNPILQSPADDFANEFDAQDGATAVIQWGVDPEAWRVEEETPGAFHLRLYSPDRRFIAQSVNPFATANLARIAAEDISNDLASNWLPEEGLHLVEYLLLRPQDDTETLFTLPLDQAGNQIPTFGNDPYSLQVAVVLPAVGGRFGDPGFQALTTEIICRELPAWLHVRVFWVNIFLMHRFETAFQAWSIPGAGAAQREQLIRALDEIHQWYSK